MTNKPDVIIVGHIGFGHEALTTRLEALMGSNAVIVVGHENKMQHEKGITIIQAPRLPVVEVTKLKEFVETRSPRSIRREQERKQKKTIQKRK